MGDFDKYIAEEAVTPNVRPADQAGFAGDALRAAAYSAIQQPIDGVTQLINQTFNTKLDVDLIDAPKPAELGSASYCGQVFGTVLGRSLLAATVYGGVGMGMDRLKIAGEGFAARVSRAAVTGAVVEGVLHGMDDPTSWTERGTRLFGGACVYGAGTALTHGLVRHGLTRPEGTPWHNLASRPTIFSSNIRASASMLGALEMDVLDTKKN